MVWSFLGYDADDYVAYGGVCGVFCAFCGVCSGNGGVFSFLSSAFCGDGDACACGDDDVCVYDDDYDACEIFVA